YDRDRVGLLARGLHRLRAERDDKMRLRCDKCRGEFRITLGSALRPSSVKDYVALLDPSLLPERLDQSLPQRRDDRIGWRWHAEQADPPVFLLCRRAKRPRGRGAEKNEEVAAVHSMTSPARARIDGGTVSPIAFAVFRLTASTKREGCCTGRSAGVAPCRILSI